jgi:iron complex outermembrane receptor protein
MKNKIILLFVAVLSAFFSFSQDIQKDTLTVDEVVVTGSKIEVSRKMIPISVSQISRQNIENSGQINVLTTLGSYAPGVFVTERSLLGFGVSTGGSGSVSIRGVSGSPNTGVLVLIDGHPQYQGIFGHPLPDAYVASDVEKIEIIRGPASILYGSNAMSGVLNIITKKQDKEGINGNVGASYGSYNTQKYYGTLGFKKNKFSVFASINHDYTDGMRDSTDFTITNGFTKIGYKINEKFNLMADISMARFKANDMGPVYEEPKPFNIDITRGKTSFSLENSFDKSEGAIKLYHNFGTHDLSDGWHSTDRNSGIMLYQTFRFFKGNSITIGSDLKQYGGKGNSGMARDTFKTVNELAIYSYVQQNLFEKLTLSAGLRLENHTNYGIELIPMAGLSYRPTDNVTIKASVSKGFRSPTIMEMYLFAPNPDLEPERLINYEISWIQSYLNKHLITELTLFQANATNIIQVQGQYPNVRRENVNSFTNKGIELSIKYLINSNLYINSNYSFLDLSKVLLAAPQQQVNFNVNYTYKILNLNISMQHIEKLYTSINPELKQNYTLLNARLALKPLKNLEIFVMGNNLLDQNYEINYGYPMPGAYFNGGLNLKF